MSRIDRNEGDFADILTDAILLIAKSGTEPTLEQACITLSDKLLSTMLATCYVTRKSPRTVHEMLFKVSPTDEEWADLDKQITKLIDSLNASR